MRRGTERALLIVAFASLGAVSSTIPASVPGAAERMGVPPDQLLQAVSLLFFGLLAGVVVAALARAPAIRVLLASGLALQTLGLIAVAVSGGVPMFLVAAFVTGLGFGLCEASATALARSGAAAGVPALLAALNGASAVGAAGAPLVIAFSGSSSRWAPIMALAAVPLGGFVLSLLVRPTAAPMPDRPQRRRRAHAVGRLRPTGLVVAAAALFLFVGAETVLAGWSGVIAEDTFGLDSASAAVATCAFWVLMAVGRFGSAAIIHRGVRPDRYLVVVIFVAAVLAATAAFVVESTAVGVLLCLVVLLVAPGYALLLGRALVTVPASRAVRTTGRLIAVGSGGGAVISSAVAATAGTATDAVLLCVAGLLVGCAALALVPFRVDSGAGASGELSIDRSVDAGAGLVGQPDPGSVVDHSAADGTVREP